MIRGNKQKWIEFYLLYLVGSHFYQKSCTHKKKFKDEMKIIVK